MPRPGRLRKSKMPSESDKFSRLKASRSWELWVVIITWDRFRNLPENFARSVSAPGCRFRSGSSMAISGGNLGWLSNV